MDENKRNVTYEKMNFLIGKGYAYKENEYGVDYNNGSITVSVFWGRYTEPIDIIIVYDSKYHSENRKHYSRTHTHGKKKVIRLSKKVALKCPVFLFIKDDIKRFEYIYNYFIEKQDALL